jgi:hypothetical protein
MAFPGRFSCAPAMICGQQESGPVSVFRHRLKSFPQNPHELVEISRRVQVKIVTPFVPPVVRFAEVTQLSYRGHF